MPALNRVQLIGRLGRDPESKYTPTGRKVTHFSLAVSQRWKAGGETKEYTEWVNIEAWERLGEVCQEYLKKGSQVHIEGRLQTRSWTDGDEVKRYVTEIIASRIQMLGRPEDRKASDPVEEPIAPAEAAEVEGTDDEDISF